MSEAAVALLREAGLLALLLVAPLLVAAVISGVFSGLVAAVTQVQDPAIGLAPRVAAVALALGMFAPSIARQLEAFANRMWPVIEAIGTSS